MKSLSLIVGSLVFFALTAVGCAPVDESSNVGAPSEDNVTGAKVSSLKAEITAVPFKKEVSKCKVEWNSITVKLPNVAAADAINKSLARNFDEYLDPTSCAEWGEEVGGGVEAKLNEGGILVVQISESQYGEGAAHPNYGFSSRVFDLATGNVIKLASAIDAEGIKTVVKGCQVVLGEGDGSAFDFGHCKDAVDASDDRSPSYGVEKEGLRIHPTSVPHVGFEIAIDGILIPWADLKGHVTNPEIKAIAGQ